MTLVERLRDENYRGVFQHLRNCTEIDSLFSEAADEIERLEKALETAREALEEIARQRLPVEIEDDLDPDFATGYEGCILRARVAIRALSQKKEG